MGSGSDDLAGGVADEAIVVLGTVRLNRDCYNAFVD
jgi:hypothetical protein